MSDEHADAPTIDYASLDLREVLAQISQSITWLSRVRDGPGSQPDLGLAAVRVQVELVAEYRELLFRVDVLKRIEQSEVRQAVIFRELEQRRDPER